MSEQKQDYKVFNNFMISNYHHTPEYISELTGYSISSINSYNTGRRPIPKPLIKIIEIYKKHEKLKESFNQKLTDIHFMYEQKLNGFSDMIKDEFEKLDYELDNIKYDKQEK